MAHQLGDLGMHFTSLSLGFLICEMGIKRLAAQVCCRDDNAGKVHGTGPQLCYTSSIAPTPSAPPHVEIARSEAEAEKQVHKTQRALKVPSQTIWGRGPAPHLSPQDPSLSPVRL